MKLNLGSRYYGSRYNLFRLCGRFISVSYSVSSVYSEVRSWLRAIANMTTECTEDTKKDTENPARNAFSPSDNQEPTTQIPFLSASASISSRSNISVFPAVTERHVAPAAIIVSIVGMPTTGTSNRMS